ncbi:MAG: hypothetical protein QOH25_3637 [Acidobacteriota bacterium]|nr:hypothetical protein [Acidobacteriota bacterium]
MPLNEEDVPSLFDAEPLRSESQGFAPDQMVRCEVCLRANPPTRTSCLYCAAQLSLTEANAALQKPTLRRLEKWEQGFNVILVPESATHAAGEALQGMAQLLRLQAEDVRRIIEAQQPLPMARATTPEEAALIERKLGEMNLKVLVIADSELSLEESALKRARVLEFKESALVFYPAGGGEAWSILWPDIVLLVTGRLFMRKIEVEERRGRRAENEIVDARETSADETVLDIYATQGNTCWRIAAGSFDFSCLGAQKKLVAAQNFSTLVEILRNRAHQAFYDDSYNRVRHALAAAWPLEQQTESRGWRRKRPGQVSTEAVTRSDNELQFTRYSRLRRYLQLHHSELSA